MKKEDHVHIWVKSKTTHVGEVCKLCGVRPIVNLIRTREVTLFSNGQSIPGGGEESDV